MGCGREMCGTVWKQSILLLRALLLSLLSFTARSPAPLATFSVHSQPCETFVRTLGETTLHFGPTSTPQLEIHAKSLASPDAPSSNGDVVSGNSGSPAPQVASPVQHVVSSAIEHPAITKCLDHLAAEGRVEVTYVGVDEEGRVSAEEVVEAFRPETALVTVMHSNNEVSCVNCF